MAASFGISSFFAASQQPIVFSIDNQIHSAKLGGKRETFDVDSV